MKMPYLLFLITLSYSISAQNAPLLQIKVKGNHFVTLNDKPIIFRGVNITDPDQLLKVGHCNKAFFQEIKNWGANIVRFPVHPHSWQANGKEKYLKILDDGVN